MTSRRVKLDTIANVKHVIATEFNNHSSEFLRKYCFEIGYKGNMEVVEWVMKTMKLSKMDFSNVIEGAANNGHLHVLKFIALHKPNKIFISTTACLEAAHNNHTHILQWLYDNDLTDDSDIDNMFINAILDNRASVLHFIRRNIPDDHIFQDDNGYSLDLWKAILEHGNHQFIDMVFERTEFRPEDHKNDCAYLAEKAHLSDDTLWDATAPSGHIVCLRYLRSKGLPWEPNAKTRARADAIGIV